MKSLESAWRPFDPSLEAIGEARKHRHTERYIGQTITYHGCEVCGRRCEHTYCDVCSRR